MKVSKETFFLKTAVFKDVPLFQAEGFFAEDKYSERKFAFYINDLEAPTIGCWGRIYCLGNIKMLRVKSLCYNTPNDDDVGIFLKEMRDNYSIVDIKDENLYRAELERVFRKSGYRRPIGQFGTNLTLIVNLHEIINYDRRWRRNIRIAKEQEGIAFSMISQPTHEQIDTVSALFKQNSKHKKLAYCYTSRDLERWMSDPKFRLFVITLSGEIIAARIIMINGRKSYDVATANGDKARNVRGCTQYLVYEIFNYLQNEKVGTFDFSCIPIGRKGAEGVCEFKEGVTSATLVQYNGDWQFTRKNWQRWLVYFINKYIRQAYEY